MKRFVTPGLNRRDPEPEKEDHRMPPTDEEVRAYLESQRKGAGIENLGLNRNPESPLAQPEAPSNTESPIAQASSGGEGKG